MLAKGAPGLIKSTQILIDISSWLVQLTDQNTIFIMRTIPKFDIFYFP